MSGEDENFVSRWSRRKTEARRADGEDLPASLNPAETAPPVARSEDSAGAVRPNEDSLQPVEDLHGLESEYKDFLRPGVDESVRRSALKKLFHDPHFNQMDGLDTYIDDYTKADPIPEAMLKALNQAKGLVFEREEEPAESETPAGASADAPTQTVALPAAGPGVAQDVQVIDPVPPKASA